MDFHGSYEDVMEPKYKLHSFRLGTQTNPSVPSQLQEFGKKINEGVKNIEIGALQVETFESIPKQHLKTISEWAKLADVGVSLHAPVVGFDAGGFEQGRIWTETKRRYNEQFLKTVLERAHLLSKGKDKDGNYDSVPVVIHATSPETKGIIYEKGLQRIKRDKNGKPIIKDGNEVLENYEDNLGVRSMRIVNQNTGEVQEIKHEIKFDLDSGKEQVWDTQRKLSSANHTNWEKEKRELAQISEEVEKREKEIKEIESEHLNGIRRLNQLPETNNEEKQRKQQFTNTLKSQINQSQSKLQLLKSESQTFNQNLNSQFQELFDVFQKLGSDKAKKEVNQLIGQREKIFYSVLKEKDIRDLQELNRKPNLSIEDIGRQLEIKEKIRLGDELYRHKAANTFNNVETPKLFVPINDFAKEKLAKTLSNVMLHTYKKFKDEAPTLAVENFWTDSALTRADDLKEAIQKSKEETIQKLVSDGVDKKKAQKWIDQHLGVTWDIGHISSLRNAGLSDEELKEVVRKETKKIGESGLVKHAHIWDNFGFHSAHLPAGTANIPIEEAIEELEKTDFRGRFIDEGGSWANSFKESPFPVVLQNFKVPIYGQHGGPAWNPNIYSVHSDSFIEFPQNHFNLYGSSFSTMPKTLGGQVGENRSRFSGTPNQ